MDSIRTMLVPQRWYTKSRPCNGST